MPMALAGEYPENEWELMETAPLDGTPIQVRRGELHATVSWSRSIHAWVIGLATEPNECDRILPLAAHIVGTRAGSLGIRNVMRFAYDVTINCRVHRRLR
jgi:hypothetical protein